MMVPNLLQQKDKGLGRKTENMDVVDSETGHQWVMGDHKLEGGMDVFLFFSTHCYLFLFILFPCWPVMEFVDS